MSPDKFWLKFNNRNKEELKEAKHGIRKEQIAPKYHNLFDGFDTNHDGVLEDKEIRNMYTHLKNFAGDDNTLDEAENLKAKSVFAQKANLPDSDFMGFAKSISDAATEIVSTKEKYTRDGGKEVTTEYKDGTIQTVSYYKNGDFKWKKTDRHIKTTTFEMEINGQKKEISEEEFNKVKNKLHEKGKISNKKGVEGQTQSFTSGVSSDNVKISTNTTERDEHKEEFSPRFIVDNFGIDTETEEGLKMVERLSSIPKDALSAIKDGKEVSELLTQNDLEADFENISNILEIVYGITLRTEEEFEASKGKREQLISQIQTVSIMSELYAAVAQYNDDYTDSQGLFGMGSEGFGWLLNKCGIQGENHYQWANSCREFIDKINRFKVLNPEKFQKEFEELTGKNNFNTQALQKMIALSKDGKAQDKDGNYTEEYKEAVKAFSNFDISNPNAKAWYHPDNLLNGFGEALTMIVTLGWGAETQGGKILAASAMSTFSRLGVDVASRQAKNKLLQGALRLSGRGIKLIGPAINEGTKMYLYTAATGTVTNITNRAAKFDSEENSLERLLDTEAAVLDGAVGSFSFGAFAGVFGSTVTQKVMQIASRTSQKVGTALADKFAAGAVDATDAYITILEKSMPTKVAEAVAFATDVFGFTAFESALAIYHALNDPKKYPNGISAEDLTTILWDEFKGQGVNLGQIKGVSYLIMWLTGSRSARMQASKYMRDNIPQLKGSTLESTENGYRIKLPNGKTVNCKNETEMISSLHLMVRGETAFSKRFDDTRIDEKKAANIRTLLQESLQPEESVKTDNKKDETFYKEETDNSIPREKIQRLFEKANGKQNVINNLQKLIDAGCSYGVLSDIVHRLDIPENIVETYIQKFKETNCDIGYSMFTLINSLQDGRKDKDEIFNDLSKIKDILLSDNTNKTSEHPTITMPANGTINEEAENSVKLIDRPLPQASQDNKFTIRSDGNDVIRPLTGKETLETLYKIKAETDKVIEQLIKDHEEFRNGKHTLREKFDESDKFFEIKRVQEKYQEAVNTAIELAERIAYEETQSKIEKEFPTIDKEKAETALKEALNKYSSGNDWYSSSLLRECTIEDKVSEELVNRTVEMLKQGISDLSMIRQFIELFTNKNGIDRAAIETYDELSKGEYKDKNEMLTKLLEACKDEDDNKFRYDYYEKFKQIADNTRESHGWVKHIMRSCRKIHVTPDSNHSYFYIDDALWAKALELKEMGFDTYDISCLMDFCRDASGISTKRMTEFSQERFDLILELKDKYNVSLDNISSILRECDHDGEFNKGEYETAIALKGHVKDEDISGYIDILQKVENKELAIKHLDELQQKYGVSSRRVMFLYKVCCDVIKDADGKEKTYKFNPLKYEKAIELKEKYNVDDFDLQKYIQTCTVRGKFEEVIYNKIIEFKEKYGFEDGTLNRIIGECIHPAKGEPSWEQSIIDYKLLDKIGVWTDLYIKSSDEVSEILQVEKNHDFREIGHNLTNILERITSVDCEATDYIEKFIQAGMIKIQTRLSEVAVRDENGYITNPPHYDTKAMDIMLEWANKYLLNDEQFSSVMYRINSQTKLPKEEAMKCISQLYQAGWEPKNTDSFRAIIEHWGDNGNYEFDLDAINLFTEYLQKGFSASVIEQAIFSCSKNGEPHTDEYYKLDKEKFDRTLEMVRYVPDDYKHEAAGWMHYFADSSESIIPILKEGKVPFLDYYRFVRQQICNTDVMNDPKKLARVPQILEQIAQHPESFNDIKEIWLDRNFPHNDKYYNFCFRHLKNSEWKMCFDAWRNLENGRGFHSGLLIDILDALDNDKMPLMPTMEWKGRIPEPVLSTIQSSRLRNNIKRYAFAICQQIDRYNGDGVNNGQHCPEVIAKIKDLMLKGELSTILLSTGGTTLVFDNPEFCKVLDALAKAEREGLGDSLIACAFHKIRGGSNVRDNHFAQNYQEIIDFYVRHKNILNADDIYKPNEAESKNTQIYNLIYSMQTEDVDLLERTLAYAQKLDNPSVIKTIGEIIVKQQNKDRYYNNEVDVKPILDFLDKVDLEKYGKEVNNLLSQMTEGKSFYNLGNYGHMDKLFDKSLSKESIEFILETEKLIEETYLDDGTASKSENGYLTMPTTNRPYLTNDFFELFLGGKVPDEALNKLQFYLEYQASMINNGNKDDIPFEIVGTGEKHGVSKIELDEIIKFVRLYKLSPDRIEFFEKYLFGTEEEADFINHIVTYLSKDEALLSEELKFLDEVLSYEDTIDSKYRIDEVLRSSTGENFEAKMEVWNLIKPKKKKLAKGELSQKLYMLLGVETFNKEVFLTAYSQNRFDDVALGNLIGHTKTSNKDLILEMLNDKKYTPEFIINIALFTNNPTRADIAKQMLKDGTFTEDQIKKILNATTERTEALSRELCFNKEINFPKEHIFDVLWACTDINKQLAWKLCTSKIKQIQVDKIPLAMSCYKNKNTNLDMYINKFKMFLDLEFSDDFIKSILGTSGSISRYTKNFCTVLQHLQQQGLKAEKCVEILTSDTLSDNITQNIDALEILNLVGSEDIKLLQADGIDIYDKIQKLQKAIDVKHPIIGVQKGNEIGTLKALANNGDADEIIRRMDLTQFTPPPNPLTKGAREIYQGIPLQYTREEFMQNMSRLITEYTSGESDKLRGFTSVERRQIPDLELSEEAQDKVKQKIEEFSYQYHNRTQDEEIILDGKKCHGVRFRGSKTNGSNPGDFYLIDGKLFYVKTPTSDKLGQSVEEVIASRLYRAAGIDAPNEHYILDKNGEVIGMASEYVPDMQPRNWSYANDAETRLMFESFAVDAWLANWDAPCNDNTQLYDNGKIIKSDVGGSMHYHARGTIKSDLNGTVIELLSLIEHNSFYSKMTKQDVLNSIKRVIDIPDATIYQTIMQSPSRDTKLAETMIRRKAYLQKFYENLEKLEEGSQNIVDLIIEAQGKTVTDFKEIPDIAGTFGYIQTENGFEGLLNTQSSDKLQLTPEQKAVADKIKAEIERFTIHNRVADNANVPQEVRDFVNSILQGVPEFAPYFGKPQHGGHQYSLDIHILNVLQKSLNNPLYDAVDKDGFKLLDDESKMVLKFSALLHDIGKMHMSGKDEGHAERSAEYVYSILDRFNLPKRVKNRIINIVNNHHWFEQLCTGAIQENTVASMFRTTSDFTIARIMAQSDLESVHEGYFTSRMSRNFPKEVSNEASAYKKFNSIMDNIQAKVTQIEESSAVVTPSKWVEVAEHIGSDGKVVPRRGFPLVNIELDGKIEQFRILNLNDLDPETDMYQYGFSHIKLKDLKLLVHRFGDGEWGKFTTTKILGDNPSRFSVQSLSLINPAHTSAYSGRNFSCIMEGNNANLGVAYYKNAGTGTRKNLSNLEEELFGSHFEKSRNFFKKEFLKIMEQRGIKLNDHQYGIIMRYARNKQYIESQLQDLNLGSVTIKRQDLVDGLLAAQEVLIEKQKHDNYEAHNEETLIDCNVIAGGASLKNIEELQKNPEFLRLCRDNCNGTIILW